MSAATKDRVAPKRGPSLQMGYPVAASTKIYANTMVALNTSGYAVPGADTAAFKVVGMSTGQVDNVSGAAGDKWVIVESGIEVLFAATSITQAMLGRQMFAVDDQTFDDTPGTNSIVAGVLTEYVSSTSGWLFMPHGVGLGSLAGIKGGRVTFGQQTTVAAADTIATGLAIVTGVVACLDADPVDDPFMVTATIGDQAGAPAAGSIILKTWKNTAGTDPTPAAATTFTKKVNWFAFGY
jgi:hypothetical protein